MNETNATKTPDAGFGVPCKLRHALSASGAFSAFEKEGLFLSEPEEVLPELYITPTGDVSKSAAEARTAPVASGEETATDAAWRIISEWNLEKGYVTQESLERLSKVLHPEVQQ